MRVQGWSKLPINLLGAPVSRWRVALYGKHRLAGETPALPGAKFFSPNLASSDPAPANGRAGQASLRPARNSRGARGLRARHSRVRPRFEPKNFGRRQTLPAAD